MAPLNQAGLPESAPSVKVVIAGAGPAGLLLANYLLTHGDGKFKVHVFDKGQDPRVTAKEGLSNRRWSIGLQKNAECSLSLVPGLAERVREESVVIEGLAICMNSKPPTMSEPRPGDFLQWTQDRVAICAAMLHTLVDSHAYKDAAAEGSDIGGPNLTMRFHCACTGIDLQHQTATFSPVPESGTPGEPFTESYDLLVGADGLRSAVRGAFQQQMRDFEMEQKEIFTEWNVAHYPPPASFQWNRVYVVPVVPNSGGCTCVIQPSVHGKVCVVMGWNYTDNPVEWLACDTPEKAHQFWTDRLPYLDMPKEAAWSLRNSPRQRSLQVKCWQYHDTTGHAVLIGDAAHATCPSLGIGCNSSLVDASVLGRLLCGERITESNRILPVGGGDEGAREFWGKAASAEEVRTNLLRILERFSALQVPEGQAVVDLSDAFLPINSAAKVLNIFVMLALAFLGWMLPFVFPRPILEQVGVTPISYSYAWRQLWWECVPLTMWKDAARRKFAEKNSAKVLAEKLVSLKH